MDALYEVTFAINLLGLVLALWLGLYLVTRNPRYLIAWLTAFTAWSLGSLFLNVLLAINPPPVPASERVWLRFMFPFWPLTALSQDTNSWLLGWGVAPAIAFWHHVTVRMLPGRLNAWRQARIWAGYLVAVLAIIAQASGSLLYTTSGSDPIYLNSLQSGAWFPVFGAALLVLTLASAINLFYSAHLTPQAFTRKQLLTLAAATLVAGLAAPLAMAGALLGLPVPMLVMSLILTVVVVISGYGVARYSALVAGRTVQHDFVYSLVGVILVTLVYLLASLFLVRIFAAPAMIVVFVPVLAVITHSLMPTFYRILDRLFYRGEVRQLRANLQNLIQRADEGEALEDSLAPALQALCSSVRASFGLILAFEGQDVHQLATYRWKYGSLVIEPSCLEADDFNHLEPGQLPIPLEDAALLVPLYAESEQLGALLLGRPTNAMRYSDEDVAHLLSMTDRIEDVLYFLRQKSLYAHQIARLAWSGPPAPLADHTALVQVDAVEASLRNLHDYSFLGDSPLGELKLVRVRLDHNQVTTLDRGKAVQEVLLEAVDKLRPAGEIPRDPPPREWYPYLILHDAYLEEKPNRDIMLDLYISEGTFNRTRRAALRSVARTLGEMELALC